MVSTRSTRGSPPTAALLPVPGKAVSLEGAEKDTDTGYYVNFRGRSPLHAAQRAAREAIEVFAARRGVKVALRLLTQPYEPSVQQKSLGSTRLLLPRGSCAYMGYTEDDPARIELIAEGCALVGFPPGQEAENLNQHHFLDDVWLALKTRIAQGTVKASIISTAQVIEDGALPAGVTWLDDEVEECCEHSTHCLIIDNIAVPLVLRDKHMAPIIDKRLTHLGRILAGGGTGQWGILTSANGFSKLAKGPAETANFKFLRD